MKKIDKNKLHQLIGKIIIVYQFIFISDWNVSTWFIKNTIY